jgi:PAS domain S-box-containing protein
MNEDGADSTRLEPTDTSLRPLSDIAVRDELVWALVEAAPDGIVMVDEAGRIVLLNRQVEDLFGYDRSQLLGRSVEELVPESLRDAHKAHRTGFRAEPQTRAMGSGLTLHGRRRDGREFPVEISLSPLETDDGLLVVAVVRDISDRVEAEARLQRAAQEMRLLEDRERIARDLHDIVIQRLFAAGMSLQGAVSLIEEPDVVERIDHVIDELDETIRELRTAIYGLQSHAVRAGGLREGIMRVIAEERDVLGIEPRVSLDGLVDVVTDDVAEHLLAVLREALSNVARHAEASSVDVSIQADDSVSLRVVDNGVGVSGGSSSGRGLRNMSDRALELGGRYEVRARPGGGTVVEWTVPNPMS